jgi:hypothetical protein
MSQAEKATAFCRTNHAVRGVLGVMPSTVITFLHCSALYLACSCGIVAGQGFGVLPLYSRMSKYDDAPSAGRMSAKDYAQKTDVTITCPGVLVFNENTPLPKGDGIISYVMTFKYLEPAKAVGIFIKLIDEPSPYCSIAAVPNAHALVATHRVSTIRKLVALKNKLDKP